MCIKTVCSGVKEFTILHNIVVDVNVHYPATRFRPPSATVVSAEPFSHGTGTRRCLQKEMATYRH